MIPPVQKEILVQTSPENAFKVFAAGEWFPAQHTIVRNSKRKELVIEPRAEGRWFEAAEDGTEHPWGKVLVWEPPRRMVLGWQLNGNFHYEPGAVSELEVNFIPEGDATRVKLEHRNFEVFRATGQSLHDSVGSPEGWSGILAKFGEALVGATTAEKKYFVCKLIPPRAVTFMDDMSDKEGAALGQHVAHWTELSKTGRAVLFGPVGDPAGLWGLGVLSASDQAEAEKIAREDPAVKSGLGFKCEVLPMLRTVLAS